MNPDSSSITYLTGAGMMVDLAAWILIGLGMLATSLSIGVLLAVARKRRIERNAAAELQMNWFAQIKPTDPAYSVPVLSPWRQLPTKAEQEAICAQALACGMDHYAQPDGTLWQDMYGPTRDEQPTAPACGVAQSCNACSECPDLEKTQ